MDAGGGEEGEWTRDVDVSTRALFAVVALDEGTRWRVSARGSRDGGATSVAGVCVWGYLAT